MNERMCFFEVLCNLIRTYFAVSTLCAAIRGGAASPRPRQLGGQESAVSFPAVSGAAPQPKSNLVHFSVKTDIWWQQLEYSHENQVRKLMRRSFNS